LRQWTSPEVKISCCSKHLPTTRSPRSTRLLSRFLYQAVLAPVSNGTPAQEEDNKHTVVTKLSVHLDTIKSLRILLRLRAAVAITVDAMVLADIVHGKVAGELVDQLAIGESWVQAKDQIGMLGSCLASAL